jgi:SAM-dependent methyltransferase
MTLHKHNQSIYTHLAPVYDEVMKDVDYEVWADFIDDIIATHFEEAQTLLELGCGTGTLSLLIEEFDLYDITATDISNEMLDVARFKGDFKQSNITFKQVDFTDIRLNETYDVVVLVFDGINYMTENDGIVRVLEQVKSVMYEESIFIVDFATATNSLKHAELMNDEGITPDHWRYVRVSRFLPAEHLHYNDFTLEKLSDDNAHVLQRYREVHVQRVYTFEEMKALVAKAGMRILAAYSGFDLDEATPQSDRITLVLQK